MWLGVGIRCCWFTPLVRVPEGKFQCMEPVRALALESVFGGGTVRWFNTEYCLRRLQKQGFSKRYRGTLQRQQCGRQLFDWFLSKHLQFPFKAVKLIIYMVDTVCFQSCCFVPPPFFFFLFNGKMLQLRGFKTPFYFPFHKKHLSPFFRFLICLRFLWVLE